MNLQVAWGLQPPKEAPVAWGARAIYALREGSLKTVVRKVAGKNKRFTERATVADIDLLHNRQAIAGHDDQQREEIARVIDKVLMPALKKACADKYLTPDSHEQIEITLDGYTIAACPRASHGYLYIGAWPASLVHWGREQSEYTLCDILEPGSSYVTDDPAKVTCPACQPAVQELLEAAAASR